MVTYNTQRMLHSNQDPPNMETIQDYRHAYVRERVSDSEELWTNLPPMPYVHTIRTNDSNRLAIVVEQRIIKEKLGFKTGKSCTSQLMNLT